MGDLIACLAIVAGGCILAGLALSDWHLGKRQSFSPTPPQRVVRVTIPVQDEPVALSGEYLDMYIYLVTSVEAEWQQRQK